MAGLECSGQTAEKGRPQDAVFTSKSIQGLPQQGMTCRSVAARCHGNLPAYPKAARANISARSSRVAISAASRNVSLAVGVAPDRAWACRAEGPHSVAAHPGNPSARAMPC